MAYKKWSSVEVCPDCGQRRLRVFWLQQDHDPPKRTDEFCDNPECRHGD